MKSLATYKLVGTYGKHIGYARVTDFEGAIERQGSPGFRWTKAGLAEIAVRRAALTDRSR